MKIILLKDVQKVGKKFDVKDVADGFATNSLLPKGLAIIATTQAVKKIEEEKSKSVAEKAVQGELLAKSIETLKTLNLTITGKANEKGHLFAGITKEMIAEEIMKTARINIDPESIILEKPIKETGEHTIHVNAGNKKAEFAITIAASK